MWTSVTDCCIKIVHQFTRRKSVLYVCERVNSNVGSAMAAARDTSSSRCVTTRSVQRDPPPSFPIQISLPDGETAHHHFNPSLKHNGGPEQEAEMMRGYLKPPENKSLSDMEPISPNRSSSMGVLGRGIDEWEGARTFTMSSSASNHPQKSYSTTSSPHPQHRHSAPLEPQNACHAHYSTRGSGAAGSSSLSLSSSSSSMSSGSVVGGSPRGRKASFPMPFLPPFLSREKVEQDRGGRRQNRSGAMRGQCVPHIVLRNPSATSTLADIAVLPCGAADAPQPSYPSVMGHDDPAPLYAHLPTEMTTPTLEDDPPPIYSEVIGNPSLYGNVSRPERRTSSGKI